MRTTSGGRWWRWAVGLAVVGLALGAWGLLARPFAVADEGLGEPKAKGENRLEIHPRIGDFATGKLGRILISAKHGGGYHTVKKTTTENKEAQTKDAKVTITVYVWDGAGDPAVGKTVYFRVKYPDPDDPSPYESNSTEGDNRDARTPPLLPAGDLSAAQAVTALATIDGRAVAAAEVELTITDRHSGDNYIVKASLDSRFSANDTAETCLLTAWKRLYVETDKMFRFGRDCADGGGGVGASAKNVYLDDTTGFAADDWVQVISNESDDHNNGEVKQIESVDDSSTPKKLVLKDALARTYKTGAAGYAHVGKAIKTGDNVDQEATYYLADTSLLAACYEPAFIEFKEMSDGSSIMPYSFVTTAEATDQQNEADCRALSQRWFKNKENRTEDRFFPSGGGSLPQTGTLDTGKSNYLHLIGAHLYYHGGTFFGTSWYSTNAVYVWRKAIEDPYSACVVPNIVRDTVCHEIGHQFDIVGTIHMHCLNIAYTPPHDGEKCIMYSGGGLAGNLTNDVVRYCTDHILTGWPTDKYPSRRDIADGR